MDRTSRAPALVAGLLIVLLAAACNPAGSASGPLPTRPLPTEVPLPTATTPSTPSAAPSLAIEVHDAASAPVQRTVDGNALQLVARLGAPPSGDVTVDFALSGRASLGTCVIALGATECSLPVRADGWAWEDGKLVGVRNVLATAPSSLRAELPLAVTAKPIVLVHGLNSDHTSWINWIKPDGYLSEVGLPGYAVDDGQFGTRRMNTGNPSKPLDDTLSIAENALILAEYVDAVRANTGAERVDLVAHSLGGLISRYYVQNLMTVVESPGLADVPVANQLFMAGTPNNGTPCGAIPAALGLFSPATTQITPAYLADVFNPAVNDRRGVPFFAIAGDAIREKTAIRCTEIPTDRYVSVNSVLRGVSVTPDQVEGVHSDLNNGRASFERIFASLARDPDEYPIEMPGPTSPAGGPAETVQSTLVQGGTLQAGETVSVTLTIDQAEEASFILYAPGSDVTMRIKTVAGKILTEETPATNPNVTFERVLDPGTPLSLGYGVIGPKAGAWELGLTASSTPPGGGPFAVVATLETGLRLAAEIEPAALEAGQTALITARMQAEAPLRSMTATATVAGPDGEGVTVELLDDGAHADGAAGDGVFGGTWTPGSAGEYTVQVAARGEDGAGNPFERLAVLGAAVR